MLSALTRRLISVTLSPCLIASITEGFLKKIKYDSPGREVYQLFNWSPFYRVDHIQYEICATRYFEADKQFQISRLVVKV